MNLESTSTVPMINGKYFGKITGSLVDALVPAIEGVFIPVMFHTNIEIIGIDIPVVIIVKDSHASVYRLGELID